MLTYSGTRDTLGNRKLFYFEIVLLEPAESKDGKRGRSVLLELL